MSDLDTKFGRNYSLLIDQNIFNAGVIESVTTKVPPPVLIEPEVDPNTGERKSLTIEFDIDRNILSSASDATIRIYNLSKTTRNKIYKDSYSTNLYQKIQLRAGYGSNIPIIFKGNVRQASTAREGTNTPVTTISCYDGGFEFVNAYFQNNYKKGVPVSKILDEILSSMSQTLTKGKISDYSETLPRGNSISGNSADLAASLSSNGFFCDLETVHCLKDNDCLPGSIKVINSSSGLLGIPQREKLVLNIDMIFEPRFMIGQLITLESITDEKFNGPYKIVGIRHQGMISDAVCGNLTTTVSLWYGTNILREIN